MKIETEYVEVVAMTHHGAVRKNNEDTILVDHWMRSTPMDTPRRFWIPLGTPVLCLVADGMGGHQGGAEASRLACESLSATALEMTSEEALTRALINVDKKIAAAAHANSNLQGMGTTVAGVMLLPDGLIWFNVGDSAIFRLRNGFLRQISQDDVPLNDRFAQRSHRITQCLGGGTADVPVVPHTGQEPRALDWRYLITSDGMTDMLTIDEIEAAFNLPDAIETVQHLYSAAMAAGGQDNISILLVCASQTDLEFDGMRDNR